MFESMKQRAKSAFRSLGKTASVASVTALALVAGPASAATAVGTSVVTLVQSYGAQAVLIVTAIILVIWGLRALGILKKS